MCCSPWGRRVEHNLAIKQQSSSAITTGVGSICWIAALGALIHVWRPEMVAGCDISWLLVWQEIFSLSMGFSRHEYWSGLPFPPPGDLPDPEIEPMSLLSPALGGSLFTTELPGKSNSHLNREESQYKVADELNCRWQQCRL